MRLLTIIASIGATYGIPAYPDIKNVTLVKRDGWKEASFTYYGGDTDTTMDPGLTGGNCLWIGKTDWPLVNKLAASGFYAAPDDQHRDLFMGDPCYLDGVDPKPKCPKQGSCNKCFEVRCKSQFEESDPSARRFGNQYCVPGKSVIVKIIDACPAVHPENSGKKLNPCNQPWPHLDVGHKAFAVIADKRVGHIWGEYRPVDCSVGLGSNNNGLPSF